MFHILGSNAKLEKVKKAIEGSFNGTYHQVQLGFKIDRNHSRWLSQAEISEGIIKAIIEKKDKKIIGVVEPLDKKPL